MSTIQSFETLQEVLEPLGAIRNENDDLGEWIHDSFAALEKLHEELTQWQSELARKETELNLRADSLEKYPQIESDVQTHLAQLENELASVKEESKKLEEANSGQLLEFEELESECTKLKEELATAHEQINQLESSLVFEQQRSGADRELWQEEFRQLRDALDEYHARLFTRLEKVTIRNEEAVSDQPIPTTSARSIAKSAELRQSAKSRRKPKK
ncbi:hypothetical protein [Bythopirellula polymerisocia]|uniref:Chromosome partition protein Smc n=1 Tax=Bythopirellula polymerisocia TaxID=2528003 RepID=A0A5C6CXF6_9BACT|nr:hypothetical protein [Bythopirellula polymerisocia]TWU28565.1 Chromosome partition protein Smc [Bythopirellula polymerisocia]